MSNRPKSPVILLPAVWLFRGIKASKRGQIATILLIGMVSGLILWQIDAVWEAFGYGLIFVAGTASLLPVVARANPRIYVNHWATLCGFLFLGVSAWGILAFIDSSDQRLPVSLGGSIGQHIIGKQDWLGSLRVVGIAAVGFGFVAPKPSLQLVKTCSWRLAKSLFGLNILAYLIARKVALTSRIWATSVGSRAIATLQRQTRRRKTISGRLAPDQTFESGGAEWDSEDAPDLVESDHIQISETTMDHANKDIGTTEESSQYVTLEDQVKPTVPRRSPGSLQPSTSELLLEKAASSDGWRLPSIEILDHKPPGLPTSEDNEGRARAIEDALQSYGIDASVLEINPGPAVTQFGIEPGWVRKFKEVRVRDENGKPTLDDSGKPLMRREEVARTRVKVDAIANLDKDLAMALAAPSIRIEAPVPGRSMVGIEVPNQESETVTLRAGLESPAFHKLKAKSKLALVLGKGSSGQTEVADLGKMPHALIAGATGSGKSISLRAILVCLLMHTTPEELRLLLIDPKRVELTTFNSVPHLLGPVIQDVEKVVTVLRWAIQEMDDRYKRFSSVGTRNLEAYNKHRLVAQPLPYLVIAIDELADLMMAAPYDVEHSLTRLAQLGRATGIHLVVATQRPSVDVVTGLIKANFPTRMSFAVSSFVDSRTILDTGGAEKLLGKGDMLYLPQDAPKPKRVQGVFVSDAEVERVVHAWNSQQSASPAPQPPFALTGDGETAEGNSPATATESLARIAEGLTQTPNEATIGSENQLSAKNSTAHPRHEGATAVRDADPLMTEARELATRYNKLSPSLLQRRLKIGYTKAEKLLELLRDEGYGEGHGGEEGEENQP